MRRPLQGRYVAVVAKSKIGTIEPTGAGKTTAHADTYHGRFAKLVENERVVEVIEFETADPALQGQMTVTITLADGQGGGTEVLAVHDGLPARRAVRRQRGRLARGPRQARGAGRSRLE